MASTEAPSKVRAALAYVDQMINEIHPRIKEGTRLVEKINARLKEDNKIKNISSIVEQIGELEKALAYLNFIKSIENISDEIETSVVAGDDEIAIGLYANLTDISCQLQSSSCHHLLNYVRDTVHFWHNHLKEKLSM